MAYDKDKLFKEAQKIAISKKCIFVDELVSYLPCSKPTFYSHFKVDSNEFNSIKEILWKNLEQKKSAMYKKWFKSNNASLQIALMKLLATDEQAHRLNGTSQKIEHSGAVNINIKEWV